MAMGAAVATRISGPILLTATLAAMLALVRKSVRLNAHLLHVAKSNVEPPHFSALQEITQASAQTTTRRGQGAPIVVQLQAVRRRTFSFSSLITLWLKEYHFHFPIHESFIVSPISM